MPTADTQRDDLRGGSGRARKVGETKGVSVDPKKLAQEFRQEAARLEKKGKALLKAADALEGKE